jgi:hypothetical protein
MIGHGLRDLIKCLEAYPRLMALPMQLIRECILYIHILRFIFLRWTMMIWHIALKSITIHHSKLLFLVMEMKRFMLYL